MKAFEEADFTRLCVFSGKQSRLNLTGRSLSRVSRLTTLFHARYLMDSCCVVQSGVYLCLLYLFSHHLCHLMTSW